MKNSRLMGSTHLDLWHDMHPGYTKENLEYNGIARIIDDGGITCLLHQSHPAACILGRYPELLGADLYSLPRVDGEWIQVPTSLVESAVRAIRTCVFERNRNLVLLEH